MTSSTQRRSRVEPAARPLDDRLRAERDGDVERSPRARSQERRRRHADDRERHAIERQRTSDDAGLAAKPSLPERVADDGHRPVRPAAALVVGGVNVRPSIAGTPSTSKKSPLAQRPSANSVAPPRDRSKRVVRPGHGAVGPFLLPVAESVPRSDWCTIRRPAAPAARARGPAATSAGRRRRARRSRCWRRCRARGRRPRPA